jgi:hypothetical protein
VFLIHHHHQPQIARHRDWTHPGPGIVGQATATKIYNLLPSKNGFDHTISSHTKLSRALGRDPTLETSHIKHLRTYGCIAYVPQERSIKPQQRPPICNTRLGRATWLATNRSMDTFTTPGSPKLTKSEGFEMSDSSIAALLVHPRPATAAARVISPHHES